MIREDSATARRYWDALGGIPPALFGVHPMGGGGALEVFYRHYHEVRHFRSSVPLTAATRFLELGCGNGRWILSLAPHVGHYTAVDFSPAALQIARARVAESGLDNVEFLEQSLADFTPRLPCDVVYFSGVTQYLHDEEIRSVLERIAPWTTPVTVIVDRSTVNERRREDYRRDDYWAVFRKPEELAALFAPHGFILASRRRSYRFLRGGGWWRWKPVAAIAVPLARLTRPLSWQALAAFSLLADGLAPKPFEGGERSHDFLVFHRNPAGEGRD